MENYCIHCTNMARTVWPEIFLIQITVLWELHLYIQRGTHLKSKLPQCSQSELINLAFYPQPHPHNFMPATAVWLWKIHEYRNNIKTSGKKDPMYYWCSRNNKHCKLWRLIRTSLQLLHSTKFNFFLLNKHCSLAITSVYCWHLIVMVMIISENFIQ